MSAQVIAALRRRAADLDREAGEQAGKLDIAALFRLILAREFRAIADAAEGLEEQEQP